MKQNIHRDGNVKREGIALVAVLGFLSILILMAVAFLMNMRTERLVAESAKDDVRTRQLTHGALATAMDDIDDLLNNYNLDTGAVAPATPNPANIRVTPTSAIIPSRRAPFTDNLGSGVQLMSGQVINWLPSKYLSSLDPNLNASNKAANANWIYIKDPKPIAGQPARILGRCAYLAFDCTGMMDANLTDYPVQRGGGTSITEVSSAFLPEAVDATLVDKDLHNNRVNYSMFGTFPEILFLNDGITNASGYIEEHALEAARVNNLMSYSLCYDNGWWDGTQWMTTGAGGALIDVRSWTETDAETVFNALYGSMTGYDPVQMARCFADYTDEDFLPGTSGGIADPETASCESIPMINEVVVSEELVVSGQTITNSHIFEIELWFPFPAETNNNYTYTVKLYSYTYDVAAKAGPNKITFSPPAFPVVSKPSITPNPLKPFCVVTARCDFIYTFPDTPTSNDFPVMVKTKVIKDITKITVTDDTAEQDVDQANFPKTTVGPLDEMKVEWSEYPAVFKPTRKWAVGAANDPRLNHLPSDWDIPSEQTMGALNKVDKFGLSANGDQEGTNMYVRNSTNLTSVAELGFIPGGKSPWTTIDLFSEEGKTLLAQYRTHSLDAKAYTNGLINPNTLYTNVLMAVFRDEPVDNYPGGPVLFKVNDQMAAYIVESIYAKGTSSYDSAAGWVTTEAFAPINGALMQLYKDPPYNMDNTKKESIIRNSYQLFNPNQQLFTIVVIAQSINDQGTVGSFNEDDDVISGEKRAVALVWRDPFPNSSGRHEMFVKLFKYLDE